MHLGSLPFYFLRGIFGVEIGSDHIWGEIRGSEL